MVSLLPFMLIYKHPSNLLACLSCLLTGFVVIFRLVYWSLVAWLFHITFFLCYFCCLSFCFLASITESTLTNFALSFAPFIALGLLAYLQCRCFNCWWFLACLLLSLVASFLANFVIESCFRTSLISRKPLLFWNLRALLPFGCLLCRFLSCVHPSSLFAGTFAVLVASILAVSLLSFFLCVQQHSCNLFLNIFSFFLLAF